MIDMVDWKNKEILARRAIEDRGFVVHDANIVFQQNCPNIDLIVYAKIQAIYIQVKSSKRPAGKDSVIVDGSPWTETQLYKRTPIYNKHDQYQASFIFIVDQQSTGEINFYIAPPSALQKLVRKSARKFAERPKKDGKKRSIKFRKELPREILKPWLNAWHLLG